MALIKEIKHLEIPSDKLVKVETDGNYSGKPNAALELKSY